MRSGAATTRAIWFSRSVTAATTQRSDGAVPRPATVRERLASGAPVYSFEFFPPKTPAPHPKLWASLRRVEQVRPAFVSVTYGAGGANKDGTVELLGKIVAETSLLPVGHLTAVGHSITELRQLAGRFAEAGVRNVLALRGDPPGDPQGEWVAHPEGVRYAEDVVRLLTEAAGFCVGVAAFPPKHPRSPDVDTDVRYFVQKCRAGADFAITQMFWDVADYFRFRDAVVAAGCDVPIIPEIMPVTSIGQLDRFAQLSGSPLPAAVTDRLLAVAADPAAVREVGRDIAVEMGQALIAGGAPGLHFITLNAADSALDVHREMPGA